MLKVVSAPPSRMAKRSGVSECPATMVLWRPKAGQEPLLKVAAQ